MKSNASHAKESPPPKKNPTGKTVRQQVKDEIQGPSPATNPIPGTRAWAKQHGQ
jgi:hypothetical protein